MNSVFLIYRKMSYSYKYNLDTFFKIIVNPNYKREGSSWFSGSPGEKMSGLKRISKDVLLMEPTALQALRTTSRLLGSARH